MQIGYVAGHDPSETASSNVADGVEGFRRVPVHGESGGESAIRHGVLWLRRVGLRWTRARTGRGGPSTHRAGGPSRGPARPGTAVPPASAPSGAGTAPVAPLRARP